MLVGCIVTQFESAFLVNQCSMSTVCTSPVGYRLASCMLLHPTRGVTTFMVTYKWLSIPRQGGIHCIRTQPTSYVLTSAVLHQELHGRLCQRFPPH